jgi:hypothetical protein
MEKTAYLFMQNLMDQSLMPQGQKPILAQETSQPGSQCPKNGHGCRASDIFIAPLEFRL